MSSLSGVSLGGGPSLGRVGDWWDDLVGGSSGGDASNAVVPKGSASNCPPGTIEFGSPSRCGSQADYDAYVKGEVAKAFGGSQQKANQYLQTTQYGAEQNYGCTAPNVATFDAAGKPMCLSPERAKDMGLLPKTTVTTGGSVAPKPQPVPPEPPPPAESSFPVVPLIAGGLLITAAVLVIRKMKKKNGYQSNEVWEEGYLHVPIPSRESRTRGWRVSCWVLVRRSSVPA